MHITFKPFASLPGAFTKPNVSVSGDAISLDGEVFDFALLPEGASLPSEAIESEAFFGVVTRADGEINVTLRLPLGEHPSDSARFPQPIHVIQDGPVPLPE